MRIVTGPPVSLGFLQWEHIDLLRRATIPRWEMDEHASGAFVSVELVNFTAAMELIDPQGSLE